MISVLLFTISASFQTGMWVRASCLAFPDSLAKIVAVAEDMSVTDIYAQVVVSGYAYYRSKILPRSQYLARVSGGVYDPLQALIAAARARSMRVHAWVNCFVVWSLKDPPDSLNHIYYRHPGWFIKDARGRSMREYGYPEWENWGLEGMFLDPANLEVREYLRSVCAEISRQYPVAGIHLDFIRYPGTVWGLPDQDENGLFCGPETDTLRWLELVRYPRLSFYLRWLVWHYWPINRDRERQILETVESIRSALPDPRQGVKQALTSAVFCNPSLARWRFAQNWADWGGLLDWPVIMSYTKDIGFFSDIFDYTRLRRPDAVYGIGLIWPEMEDEAWWEINRVRENSGAGVSLFEYTTLDTLVSRQALKGDILVKPESLTFDSTRYLPLNSVYADPADPVLVAEGEKLLAWERETEFAAYLLSLSLVPSVDLARLGLDREGFLKRLHEDVCAFAALDRLVLPVSGDLIEPPQRQVDYAFFAWRPDSTAIVQNRAQKARDLPRKMMVFPRAMDKFSRAVFSANKGERLTCSSAEGVYVFKVRKIVAGGRMVKRGLVKPELLPVYLNWTLKERIRKLVPNAKIP
jgi:uncharacterized lipoprotein YddW (UPF0748 family)